MISFLLQCEPNQSNEIPLHSGPVLRSGVLQSSFDALTLENLRIGHLLIDHFDNITILFVITLDGLTLRKYSFFNNQLCLIEHIELKPTNIPENQWKINRAEFILETVNIIFFFFFFFPLRNLFVHFSERNSSHNNQICIETLGRTL